MKFVSIIMGSKSDYPTMKEAIKVLDKFGSTTRSCYNPQLIEVQKETPNTSKRAEKKRCQSLYKAAPLEMAGSI